VLELWRLDVENFKLPAFRLSSQRISAPKRSSRLLFGLDLDNDIDVVADRAQERLHAEIGTLKGATRRQASGILFVERVLAYFVQDDVEPHRLCHAAER
jgi:hypothetical protein